MAAPNGATLRLLEYIRKHGSAITGELAEQTGIEQKQVSALLLAHVETGKLATDFVPSTKGGRPTRRYTWLGGEPTVARVPRGFPSVTPTLPASPRSSGMRRCLGGGCGRMFHSSHAGNRLCPRCVAAIARDGSGNSFDIPLAARR